MTVLDTSAVVDLLTDGPAAAQVADLLRSERELAAPDVLVVETLSVIRRAALRSEIPRTRAAAAIDDLGDIPLRLFSSMALRGRAWELRQNFTSADALFVSLAERLGEPIATKDAPLVRALRQLDGVSVTTIPLG